MEPRKYTADAGRCCVYLLLCVGWGSRVRGGGCWGCAYMSRSCSSCGSCLCVVNIEEYLMGFGNSTVPVEDPS
jgi:hypothetical protein